MLTYYISQVSLECLNSLCLCVCISPHPCIVCNSCSLPSCARWLCFLPVSFVLLDVSAWSSSLPLRSIYVPSSLSPFFFYFLSPLCPHLFHIQCRPCPTCYVATLTFCLFRHTSSPTFFFSLASRLSHSSRLCVSPQDSTSSTGSAELTGIKELDDLSQEIAQLQR